MKATLELETPYEGVPEHLLVPLRTWVNSYLDADADLVMGAGINLRLALPNPHDGIVGHMEAMQSLHAHCARDRGLLLDLIEFILRQRCSAQAWALDVDGGDVLENLLETANSAYKVRADREGLEMRTTAEVQAQVQSVVDSAPGSPGEHLANAWNEAYSRSPDPVKSFSESIKAVEAALARHISPSNTKQTLGTMIRDVSAKPSKWEFVISGGATDSVEPVLSMMRALWSGQTSRHGGTTPTVAETLEQAQAAVHLAATLVQFGVSGALSAR